MGDDRASGTVLGPEGSLPPPPPGSPGGQQKTSRRGLSRGRLAEGEGTTHPPQGHIALVLALGCEWGLKCSLPSGRVLGGGRLLRLWGPATCWLSVYQRFPPSSCFEGGP